MLRVRRQLVQQMRPVLLHQRTQVIELARVGGGDLVALLDELTDHL